MADSAGRSASSSATSSCQGGGLAVGNDPAALTVGEKFRRPAHRRRNDRDSGQHGLEHDKWAGLGRRGHHQEVEGGEERADLIHPAGESHPACHSRLNRERRPGPRALARRPRPGARRCRRRRWREWRRRPFWRRRVDRRYRWSDAPCWALGRRTPSGTPTGNDPDRPCRQASHGFNTTSGVDANRHVRGESLRGPPLQGQGQARAGHGRRVLDGDCSGPAPAGQHGDGEGVLRGPERREVGVEHIGIEAP